MSCIYDYEQRLRRYKHQIEQLGNSEMALRFLNHLDAQGLTVAGLSKYAGHMISLLRAIDFDLEKIRREDAERVVVWINSQPYRESTKYGKKLVLRRLVQYAKCGRCDRETPFPDEVKWIKLRVNDKDLRATPESLLTPQDFAAIVKATENTRDRALIHVLCEGALRPGDC